MFKKQHKAIDRIINIRYDNKTGGGFEHNGKYYIFCPYMALAYNQQNQKEKLTVSNDFSFEEDKNKVSSVFKIMEDSSTNATELILPTLAELKAEINARNLTRIRRPEQVSYTAGDGEKRYMNPFYLMDIYEAMNIGKEPVKAYVTNSIFSPIYIKNGVFEAVLMPCRPQK